MHVCPKNDGIPAVHDGNTVLSWRYEMHPERVNILKELSKKALVSSQAA